MNVESYGISDIGLSRANNEDVFAELPDCQFYVLADGMGGHRAGEVASKEAVLQLCDAIDILFSEEKKPTPEETISGLKSGIAESNHWVYTLSRNHPELSGMGTTLCCFILLDNLLIYAHVGDSRIYRLRKKLERLTDDHSFRNPHTFKSVLSKAIGTTPSVEPDVATANVQDGDYYFLCSDGLTDYVSDMNIEKILQKAPNIKEACLELVEAAKTAGGNDNITILMVRAHEPH